MQEKQLTKEDVIKIIKEESYKNMTSGTPRVAPHNHDGNNAFKIEQKNIIPNLNGNAIITSNVSEVFTLTTVSNPTTLTFYGFAANNAAGGAATLKAIVNGVAQLGLGYEFTSITGTAQTNSIIPGPSQNITHSSNAMYIDTSSVANTKVFAASDRFVYVENSAGTSVAEAKVISFTDKSITIQTTLASGWQITGNFLVT